MLGRDVFNLAHQIAQNLLATAIHAAAANGLRQQSSKLTLGLARIAIADQFRSRKARGGIVWVQAITATKLAGTLSALQHVVIHRPRGAHEALGQFGGIAGR